MACRLVLRYGPAKSTPASTGSSTLAMETFGGKFGHGTGKKELTKKKLIVRVGSKFNALNGSEWSVFFCLAGRTLISSKNIVNITVACLKFWGVAKILYCRNLSHVFPLVPAADMKTHQSSNCQKQVVMASQAA